MFSPQMFSCIKMRIQVFCFQVGIRRILCTLQVKPLSRPRALSLTRARTHSWSVHNTKHGLFDLIYVLHDYFFLFFETLNLYTELLFAFWQIGSGLNDGVHTISLVVHTKIDVLSQHLKQNVSGAKLGFIVGNQRSVVPYERRVCALLLFFHEVLFYCDTSQRRSHWKHTPSPRQRFSLFAFYLDKSRDTVGKF